MLLDYMLQDAALRPHIPYLLARWVQIYLSNWLDDWWVYRDVVPPLLQFNNLRLQLKLKEAWAPTFPHDYSPDPPGPQILASLRYMWLSIMWFKHNAAVASAVASAITPANDCACATAAAITTIGGGRPNAVVPYMSTSPSAAAAK